MPPPTSFLYLISARSGSMPVVSQSIMKPMVPVGASTVTWELRYPNFSPLARASSQVDLEASIRSGNCEAFTAVEEAEPPMLLTEARCMRMTSRKGSRLMYQPGQVAPQVALARGLGAAGASLVFSKRWAFSLNHASKCLSTFSVAVVSGGHNSAMREDWR